MVPYRDTIGLNEGVRVDLLVTPHLYSYKGYCGLTLQLADNATSEQTAEFFADLIWAAALNAWEIDLGGKVAECPTRRGDVHALMLGNPTEFRRAVDFIAAALTGGKSTDGSKKKTNRPPLSGGR